MKGRDCHLDKLKVNCTDPNLEKANLLINDIIESYITTYNLTNIDDICIVITVTGSFACFFGLVQG